jgi:putative hydrolase of the HAD superfamily
MEHYHILEYFDVLSFSDELRIRKPHPQIFLSTLEKLKSAPSTSIHIGDEFHTDVKGAKGVGMTAIHFNKGGCDYQEIRPDYSIRKLKEIRKIVQRLRQA